MSNDNLHTTEAQIIIEIIKVFIQAEATKQARWPAGDPLGRGGMFKPMNEADAGKSLKESFDKIPVNTKSNPSTNDSIPSDVPAMQEKFDLAEINKLSENIKENQKYLDATIKNIEKEIESVTDKDKSQHLEDVKQYMNTTLGVLDGFAGVALTFIGKESTKVGSDIVEALPQLVKDAKEVYVDTSPGFLMNFAGAMGAIAMNVAENVNNSQIKKTLSNVLTSAIDSEDTFRETSEEAIKEVVEKVIKEQKQQERQERDAFIKSTFDIGGALTQVFLEKVKQSIQQQKETRENIDNIFEDDIENAQKKLEEKMKIHRESEKIRHEHETERFEKRTQDRNLAIKKALEQYQEQVKSVRQYFSEHGN